MPPVTNQMLNARREPHCTRVTSDHKYYVVDGSFVKRSLRPSEWQHGFESGTLHVPPLATERLLNEAATLRYLAGNTWIPVPRLYASFQDDEAVYLVTEYIDGVTMAELNPRDRETVAVEVEYLLRQLESTTSDTWGGPSGLVVPPWRVIHKEPHTTWKLQPRKKQDLVFCHGDLSADNIIVDPETLRIRAIVDWEHAGFYPKEFEGEFFRRPGPCAALDGEVDDVQALLHTLRENSE